LLGNFVETHPLFHGAGCVKNFLEVVVQGDKAGFGIDAEAMPNEHIIEQPKPNLKRVPFTASIFSKELHSLDLLLLIYFISVSRFFS
jgi:hypothetical protein